MECLNTENQIDRRRLRRPDEDRISTLPDSVLQHILAFVLTNYAVRTSILSRRWKNIWKSVPCLDLDTDDFSDENDFFNFMDKFLDFHSNSYLQKFRLHYDMPQDEISRLKSWMDASIMCKLEHLEVQIDFQDGYTYRAEMPKSIFLCSTLVFLELSRVFVDIPELVSLYSLKVMRLEDVVYADNSTFKTLISGCPVLEELDIERIDKDNVQVMCVCSHTLKWLSIRYSPSGPGSVLGIVINASHLEYLSLVDHLCEDLVITNLGSSLEAEIDVAFNTHYGAVLEADDFSKRSNIRRFLVGISNVESLRLSTITLKLLSKYLKVESLPQFHGLIHLTTDFGEYGWEVLPVLLVCCPNLKSFFLNCRNRSYKPLVPPSSPPQCLLSLESITLHTHITDDEAEMGIIRYFLENASVLEELNIHLHTRISEETAFLKEILTYPRRSSACRIFVGF